MRPVVALAALALLAGCASNEYSKMPEPTGEWVPANPPSLMASVAPRPAPTRVAWHRRPRRVMPVHTASAQ